MKKIFAMAGAAFLAAAVLTGCGSKAEETADAAGQSGIEKSDIIENIETDGTTQLDEVKEKGKLVIAMEGQWSPWTYHDESGELVGYDTEVAQAIADKLGLEAEFVEGEWDGLFAGLDAGRYDVVVNGVEITEERGEKYAFSTPYAYVKTVIVCKKGYNQIDSFQDLSGKKTANSLGSTYADMAASYGASVENVDTLAETIDMLVSGRVDATLNSEDSILDYLKQHPDADIEIVAYSDESSQVAIPISRAQIELKEAIDKALAELSEEGVLAELSEKYFGKDISVKPHENTGSEEGEVIDVDSAEELAEEVAEQIAEREAAEAEK